MTAEIVNLRMARKARKRSDAASEAEAMRLKHGQTKGQRKMSKMDADRLSRTVDGAKRDSD